MTKRQQQAATTRKHIYEVSMKLFEEYDFDKVTIGQICKAAEVSVGAFYHHFEKKEDILVEQYRMIDKKLCVEDFSKLEGDNWPDKVVNYIGSYVKSAEEDGYRTVNEVYRAWLTLHRPFSDENAGFQKSLQDLLTQGIEEGVFKKEMDAHQAAEDLLIIVRGIVYFWCQHKGEFSLCGKTENMIRAHMSIYVNC